MCFGKKDNGDGTFNLTLIPYSQGVYTADQGLIPEFDSKVTSPQKRFSPQSYERPEYPRMNGTIYTIYLRASNRHSSVSWETENIYGVLAYEIQIAKQYQIDNDTLITDLTLAQNWSAPASDDSLIHRVGIGFQLLLDSGNPEYEGDTAIAMETFGRRGKGRRCHKQAH